jgi:hypothetical protein
VRPGLLKRASEVCPLAVSFDSGGTREGMAERAR